MEIDTDNKQAARDEVAWRPGRRSFIGLTAATAVTALLPGRSASAASPPSSTFAIDSAPGVKVHVGSGRLFPVTVIDADGNTLQNFKRLSYATIHGVRSPHFTVRSIEAPRPS